jgi:hypothetical protein
MIQVLIAISQLLNACLGGDADEMLSSRAWRCRNDSAFWGSVRWWLDNASPLMWWRDAGMTHCESCYWAEIDRLDVKWNNSPSWADQNPEELM